MIQIIKANAFSIIFHLCFSSSIPLLSVPPSSSRSSPSPSCQFPEYTEPPDRAFKKIDNYKEDHHSRQPPEEIIWGDHFTLSQFAFDISPVNFPFIDPSIGQIVGYSLNSSIRSELWIVNLQGLSFESSQHFQQMKTAFISSSPLSCAQPFPRVFLPEPFSYLLMSRSRE